MIPPTLLQPLPTMPAPQAGVQTAVVGPWSHLPPAPFLRADWQDVLRLQLVTGLSTWPTAHLWFANLTNPGIFTGGHWSPLVTQHHAATPLLLLSTPDTHDGQTVERLHQISVPRSLHPRLLGQSFGIAMHSGDVQLHRHDQQIRLDINHQRVINAHQHDTASRAATNQNVTPHASGLPAFWLTMQRDTPRLLRLEAPTRPQDDPWFTCDHAEGDIASALMALHPLLKNAQVAALQTLRQALTVTLHRPVCIAGAGCLRAWGTLH